ncbi:MAG: hypothetical protein AABY22_35390 [Nanoarchaeota archaeon]
MTKKQLLKKLEKVPDNTEIILASNTKDSWGVLDDLYIEKGMRFGYLLDDYIDIVYTRDINNYFTQKDYDKYKECVVLFPK